ncbi:MAG: bifunctional demethylmenaquinone methyltransferase/2-methoxy-6-polyprenyl-1,4-benzoquinol methylase UbiE [Chitinophagales bacterium]|jgi:demethylmenaquinone methyltransferase/2-methoxy-6-polyprenyl-1,4-benzoquinol methylase|nr:bifunctional demethylmenaquinone methyltransferase/2-methoxy-6-polyprenyl-1,4-benzoquinol methylase UbiE [Chitinophagales bacterium]
MEVEKVKPYQASAEKTNQIEAMFDAISPQYDLLNRIMTLGIDIYWRNKAISTLKDLKPKAILDVATGTGDFAFAALKLNPERILAVDLSQKMLDVAIEKQKKVDNTLMEFRKVDILDQTLETNSFDAITVGFGVRNFEDIHLGLGKLYTYLKPGGKLVILEPGIPKNKLIQFLFNLYFNRIVPLIGRIISKDQSAYTYLPNSVAAFPSPQVFLEILGEIGFENNKYEGLSFETCALYTATKPF